MRHVLFVMTALWLSAGSPAGAAEVAGRYLLEKVDQGFLRLDSATGAMALCAATNGVWQCQAIKDQGLDLAAETARLRAENDKLKARVAELESKGAAVQLPSEGDVDRMMDVFGRMFDRFLDFARKMDRKDETSL